MTTNSHRSTPRTPSAEQQQCLVSRLRPSPSRFSSFSPLTFRVWLLLMLQLAVQWGGHLNHFSAKKKKQQSVECVPFPAQHFHTNPQSFNFIALLPSLLCRLFTTSLTNAGTQASTIVSVKENEILNPHNHKPIWWQWRVACVFVQVEHSIWCARGDVVAPWQASPNCAHTEEQTIMVGQLFFVHNSWLNRSAEIRLPFT